MNQRDKTNTLQRALVACALKGMGESLGPSEVVEGSQALYESHFSDTAQALKRLAQSPEASGVGAVQHGRTTRFYPTEKLMRAAGPSVDQRLRQVDPEYVPMREFSHPPEAETFRVPLHERLSYTLKDASAATGIGRHTLLTAIHAGRLRAVRVGENKGKWVIPRRYLEQWLEEAVEEQP